jgi:hypothetical protein
MEPKLDLEPKLPKETLLGTWLVVFLLLAFILAKGLFSFYVVGDFGMPDWNYGVVADVPGESPYAVYEQMPYPQHVSGDAVDYPQLTENWDQSLFPYPKQIVTGE